jgi:hypothetical protein
VAPNPLNKVENGSFIKTQLSVSENHSNLNSTAPVIINKELLARENFAHSIAGDGMLNTQNVSDYFDLANQHHPLILKNQWRGANSNSKFSNLSSNNGASQTISLG